MKENKIPTSFEINNQISKERRYELELEDDKFIISMEMFNADAILFKLKKINKLFLYYYTNKFSYDDIIKKFLLQKDYYKDLISLFNFLDLNLTKGKINLEYNKNNNTMILKLTEKGDSGEIEYKLELNENKIENEEMFCLLINEINEL